MIILSRTHYDLHGMLVAMLTPGLHRRLNDGGSELLQKFGGLKCNRLAAPFLLGKTLDGEIPVEQLDNFHDLWQSGEIQSFRQAIGQMQ